MDTFKKIFSSFSEKERRIFLAAGGAAIFSGLILLIVAIRGATLALPVRGGEYTEGFIGQPTFVNPILAETEVDKSLVRLIFAKLEDLTRQVEIDKSGQFWSVRLKEDLIWTDGKPLTSDDIIFTIQKTQDENAKSPAGSKWAGVTADRVSELEVRIKTPGEISSFESEIKNLYLLPKHIFADVPILNWRLSDYNLSPVGSGFYRFNNYEKDRRGFITLYELGINPNFQGKAPLIEKVNFKFYSDKESLVGAFNKGAISGIGGLEPQEIEKIQRPFSKFSFRSPSYYAVFLNQARNPILKELATREALSLSVPREALVREVLEGSGQAVEGPVVQGTASENGFNQASSLREAKSMLDEAGWQNYNPSNDAEINSWIPGVRQKISKKEKVNLEVNLTVPEIPFLIKTAEKLKAAWEEAGFKITITRVPEGKAFDNIIKNRDYEMLLYGNFLGADLDLSPFWHSSERFYPGLNLSLYSNKEADGLLSKLEGGLAAQDRNDTLNKLQDLIKKDYPAVFLYSPSYVLAAIDNLKGVQGKLVADPADRFKEIYQWNLKTARVFK